MRFSLPLLLLLALGAAELPRSAADSSGSADAGAAREPASADGLAAPHAATRVPTSTWLFAADTPRVSDRTDGAGAAPTGPLAPEVRTLRSELARAVSSPGWREDRWSVLAVSLDRGDTLFSREPDASLAPASNMKLYTSAAALHYLGAEFRYATYLLADGRIRDGVLEGDLVLYGTGDPTISNRFLSNPMSVWESFADALAGLGVRRITGAVVGDASFFGGTEVGVGWRETYMNAWYAAPSSALAFNENLVTLRVRPAAQAGWRPEIQLLPGGQGIALVNHATTVRGGRTRIDVDRVAYDGPIIVSGQIATGSQPVWRQVPVADPPRYAAATLREVLEQRGIGVDGGIRAVDHPDASPVGQRRIFAPALDDRAPLKVVAVHRSPPLREILAVVNQRSHNLYADQVLRTVGRVAGGDGRMSAGAELLETFLAREVGTRGVKVFDGSGLSPLNRSSAADLVALLRFMHRAPERDEFAATLPAAGGERLRRMLGTPAEANLHAKTGTIDRVSSLSGYVRAGNGERIAFAIISNDVPSTWRAKRVEDAIGERLASFRRQEPVLAGAPATDDLAAALGRTGPERALGAVARRPEADRSGRAAAPASSALAAETGAAGDPSPERVGLRVHVIRPGDTLDGIARRHGITVAQLRAANPGVEPRRLIPGRELKLP